MKKMLALFLLILFLICCCITDTTHVTAETTSYPLLVYGGEPEGIISAVAAARKGVKTLLLMNREKPGGLMTYGCLNYLDINQPNLTVLNNCQLISTENSNGIITDIIIKRNNNKKKFKVKRVIDASQNADLAVKAGAPYFRGGSDIGLP